MKEPEFWLSEEEIRSLVLCHPQNAAFRMALHARVLFAECIAARKAMDRHNLWCGHKSDSPGDASINEYGRQRDNTDAALRGTT